MSLKYFNINGLYFVQPLLGVDFALIIMNSIQLIKNV